jgi:hypothetical protein
MSHRPIPNRPSCVRWLAAGRCRRHLYRGSLLTTLATTFLVAFASSASAETFDLPWVGSGLGTVNVVSNGTIPPAQMNYKMNPAGLRTTRTWSFSTTAGSTGTRNLKYEYTGFHAYFQVTAFLRAFVTHEGVTTHTSLVSAGPVNCCTSPSGGFAYVGRVTLNVQSGDTYGFEFGGSNGDSNNDLEGTLTIPAPKEQAITFTSAPPNPAIRGGSYTPTATGGESGNPVVFSIDPSSAPGACLLTSGRVEFTGAGTCVIDANQEGNVEYRPAPQVQQSFTIAVKNAPAVNTAPPAPAPVAPLLSDLIAAHRCVAAASLGGPSPGGHGLAFSLNLSETSNVTFTVMRRVGSPQWSKCPRPRGRKPGTYRSVGELTGLMPAGSQTTSLGTAARSRRMRTVARLAAGRHRIDLAELASKRLRPGTYILTAKAVNSAGQSSGVAYVKFWVFSR